MTCECKGNVDHVHVDDSMTVITDERFGPPAFEMEFIEIAANWKIWLCMLNERSILCRLINKIITGLMN